MGRRRVNKCESCRRRHLKCDLTLPSCAACLRHGFECERTPIDAIVFYTPKKNQARPLLKPRGSVPPALKPVMDEQVWLAHLHHSLPPNAIPQLRLVGLQDSLAQRALVALSCSFFGRSRRSEEFIRNGNDKYLHCLREVNGRLGDSEQCTSVDTLATVAIFGFYECLLLTAQAAWIKHYAGLAKMIEMAGPEACKNPAFAGIFHQNRFMMCLAAMASNSTSFLSRSEWKVPRRKPPRVGCIDELLDVVTDLPTLRTGHGTVMDALSIFRRLEGWHDTWHELLGSDLVTSIPSDSYYPKTWQHPIISCDLHIANYSSICNAATIMAIDHALVTSTKNDLQPGEASGLFHRRYESAVGICRILDYHLLSNESPLGGLFILWPLRMAAKVFRSGNDEENTWLKQRTDRLMESKVIWNVQQETFLDYT